MHDFKRFPELANSQMQFYYWDSPHKQILEDFNAKVVRIIDGDTIDVQWSERNFPFPVRFLNTQAPEMDEVGGLESKKWLEKQILNEEVEIKINPKNRVGNFGRILGEVIHMGRSINQLSMDEGFADVFTREERLWR